MPEHALYCIDTPPAQEISAASRLAGWCLATRPIEAVEAVLGDGSVHGVVHGLERPDVAAAYAAYPGAARAGFELELPPGALGDGGLELALTLRRRRGPERLRFAVHLGSNDVQQVDFRPGLRSFDPETLEARLQKSLGQKPGLTFRLDIVNKCNLRCVMCHYSDDAVFRRPMEKMTPETFRRLFEDVAPVVRNVVLSCADEPLTSNHFPDILSYLADSHPHVDVEFCTNATLMNARIRHLLVEKGVGHLILSVDGVKKETLESIRVGAKYPKVLGNIMALRDLKRAVGARHPAFVMDFVMMNRNVHEAPVFVELAARLEAAMIDFRHVIPSRYFHESEELLVNHQAKFNHYRREVLAAGRRFGIDVVIPPPYDTAEGYDPSGDPEVDLGDFLAVQPDAALGELPVPRKHPADWKARHARGTAAELFSRTYCERPFSEVLISDLDLVKPCAWHRKPLGRLSDGQTLADVFFGPEFERLRRNMLRPEGDPNCQGCPVKAQYLMSETAQFSGQGAALSRLKQWLRRLKAAI